MAFGERGQVVVDLRQPPVDRRLAAWLDVDQATRDRVFWCARHAVLGGALIVAAIG